MREGGGGGGGGIRELRVLGMCGVSLRGGKGGGFKLHNDSHGV